MPSLTARPSHLRLVPKDGLRTVELPDLPNLRFQGDLNLPVELAKAWFYGTEQGKITPPDETFYGHGFLGHEPISDLIRVIHLDDTAAPPTLIVRGAWTLDRLYEVCRLAAGFALHEMTGDGTAIDAITEALIPHGLTFGCPRNPDEAQADYRAAGGDPDQVRELASLVGWLSTTFLFMPASGTLKVSVKIGL